MHIQHRFLRWLLLALGVTLISSLHLFASEMRTWTDSSGKFSIMAKLVSAVGNNVALQRDNGAIINLPLDRLSARDQSFVKSWIAKNTGSAIKVTTFEGPVEGEPELVQIDLSKFPRINTTPVNQTWTVDVSPITPPSSSRFPPLVELPKNPNVPLKFTRIAVNQQSSRALIAYQYQKDKVVHMYMKLVDLASGRSLAFDVTIPENKLLVPLALQDNGYQALMRKPHGGDKSDRLELWKFSPTGVTRVAQWLPGTRDVVWGEFLQGNRVITVESGGRLVVWDVTTGQPVLHHAIEWRTTPGLSPDRRYLCYAKSPKIAVLDLEKGEVICQKQGGWAWPSVRFSPSGTRVAILHHNGVRIMDFATGETIADVGLRGGRSFCFPSEDYVLIGANELVDVKNEMVIWKYEGCSVARMTGDTCWFLLGGGSGQTGAMVPTQVPHDSARDAMNKLMGQPDFWVLHDGMGVRINVDAVPDSNERGNVVDALTKRLEAYGYKADDAAKLNLIVSIEESKEKKKISYGRGPFASGGKVYQVREFVNRLKFVSEGKTVWETSADNIPKSIRLARGETIEQLLRKHEKPNYEWFGKAPLPKALTKPGGAGAIGASKVTTAGVR